MHIGKGGPLYYAVADLLHLERGSELVPGVVPYKFVSAPAPWTKPATGSVPSVPTKAWSSVKVPPEVILICCPIRIRSTTKNGPIVIGVGCLKDTRDRLLSVVQNKTVQRSNRSGSGDLENCSLTG